MQKSHLIYYYSKQFNIPFQLAITKRIRFIDSELNINENDFSLLNRSLCNKDKEILNDIQSELKILTDALHNNYTIDCFNDKIQYSKEEILERMNIEYKRQNKLFSESIRKYINDLIYERDELLKINFKYQDKYKDNKLEKAKNVPIESLIPNQPVHNGSNRVLYSSPFKNKIESTPSFNVYKETNTFYDFSLGEGGDVIDFYTKLYGVTVADAIDALAKFN